MAKISCINSHGMWNGDGKPEVWAFRIEFFEEYMQKHPDYILMGDDQDFKIYDCYDDLPEEELDCWYCDKCGSLAVLTRDNKYRYDLIKTDDLEKIDDIID